MDFANLFLTLHSKLILAGSILAAGIIAGWSLHGTWDDAKANHSAVAQLTKAQAVPAKISKFNQDLRKTNVDKTPCYGVPIPTDVLKLLK